MRFVLFLPPFGEFADPDRLIKLARSAEGAGWDGLFLWDHMLAGDRTPIADPWVMMSAIAAETASLRLGALVTPLTRRRPWVLARQIATLDRLSKGRLVAGIGLGDDGWSEFSSFSEPVNALERAQVLDEALELLQRFLAGDAVDFDGRHFHVHAAPLLPVPVQVPMPLWAACRWPYRKPLHRAARLQGCFPIFRTDGPPPPPGTDDIEAIRRTLLAQGASPDIDVVIRCSLSLEDPGSVPDTVGRLETAGVTWLLEGFGPYEPAAPVIEQVVSAGPVGRR